MRRQAAPGKAEEGLSPVVVEDAEDPDECAVVRTDGGEAGTEVHVYDYWVVYSTTYQVPVLYFQGSRLGACQLECIYSHGDRENSPAEGGQTGGRSRGTRYGQTCQRRTEMIASDGTSSHNR